MEIKAIKSWLNNKPYKLSKKINSAVIGGVALTTAILVGSANLGRDRNYEASFRSFKQNNIIELQDHALARLIKTFGIEDLHIEKNDELFYDFQGRIGATDKISGQFYQNYHNKNQLIGIISKKGIFSEKVYDFMINFDKTNEEKPQYTFDLSICPNNDVHEAKSMLIEQKPDGYSVTIDGKKISDKETRDAATFAYTLIGISIATLVLAMFEKNSKKPYKVLI